MKGMLHLRALTFRKRILILNGFPLPTETPKVFSSRGNLKRSTLKKKNKTRMLYLLLSLNDEDSD